MIKLKPRTERRNWTELNWHGLVTDEMTNRQAVMHYSGHCLTASVTTWLRARTRQPMSSAKLTVSGRSVQSSYVAVYATL